MHKSRHNSILNRLRDTRRHTRIPFIRHHRSHFCRACKTTHIIFSWLGHRSKSTVVNHTKTSHCAWRWSGLSFISGIRLVVWIRHGGMHTLRLLLHIERHRRDILRQVIRDSARRGVIVRSRSRFIMHSAIDRFPVERRRRGAWRHLRFRGRHSCCIREWGSPAHRDGAVVFRRLRHVSLAQRRCKRRQCRRWWSL